MIQKVFINCIKNSRLFKAALGTTKMEEREREHLHECRVCQSVFHIFIEQHEKVVSAA